MASVELTIFFLYYLCVYMNENKNKENTVKRGKLERNDAMLNTNSRFHIYTFCVCTRKTCESVGILTC